MYYNFPSSKTILFLISQILAESVSRIGNNEQKVKIEVVNPKTLTQGQLVGHLEPMSREWTDGIVAQTLRLFFTYVIYSFPFC